MSVMPLSELIDERKRPLPLSVKQYHAMIENGILLEGSPYELLDGYIVPKDRSAAGDKPMTIGLDHVWVVSKLASFSSRLERLGCHLRTQLPISIPPQSEPEPDAMIVLGTVDDYRGRNPGPKDVLAVIEVADSSLSHDRSLKLRIYADCSIPTYVIINLPDRVVEVYTQPLKGKHRYGRVETLPPGKSVVFPGAGGRTLSIPVRRLLP